jgi:tetratricopeptide (TPR) repeat protein
MMFLVSALRIGAQQLRQTSASSLEQRIANERELMRAGERKGIDSLHMGRLWAKLASDYEDAGAYVQSEDAYNHALKLFGASPEGAADYAIELDNLGSLYLIKDQLNAAEEIRKRSMALREAAGDELQIALGHAHLAEVAFARHKYKEAEEESAKAYREMVAVKDPSAEDFVSDLFTLTYSSSVNREYADAVAHGMDALSRARAAFASNSMQVGGAQMALGYAEWKAGKKDDADRDMRDGLEALREGMMPGHPYVLGAMRQYSEFLERTHRKREAKQVAEEEKRLEVAPAAGCNNCTISVYGLRAK